MYHFYVLRSEKDGNLYKGSTSRLDKRIQDHNMGRVSATKYRRPLHVLYTEEYRNYEDALAREKYSKTLKGGKEIQRIIDSL